MKIGLMLDSLENQPFWCADLVRFLHENQKVQLCTVLLNENSPQPKPKNFIQKLRKNNFLYNRYSKFDHKRISSFLNKYPTQDLKPFLAEAKVIPLSPMRKKFSDYFTEEQVQTVKSCDLDIIIRLGFRIIRGEVLNSSNFGIWSFHHGDNDEFRGGPAGFWEVFEKNPCTGATLQVLTDSLDGGFVLGKTHIRTDKTSPLRNRINIGLAGNTLLENAIQQILKEKPTDFQDFQQKMLQKSKPYKKRIYRAPSNIQMSSFLTDQLSTALKRKLKKGKSKEQWSVGFYQGSPLELDKQYNSIKWHTPESSHFLADPFPITHEGQMGVFVEEFDYKIGKGFISYMSYDQEKKKLEKPQPVIKQKFHMSFPFLLQQGQNLFMVPEQKESGKVALYKCTKYPYKWVEEAILLDGMELVDVVLHYEQNKWWLFGTKCGRFADHESQNNLHIFHSDTLTGPYTPIRQSPAKQSLSSSRMAGKIYSNDGKLYRWAQNCSERYGGSIKLFEITKLNTIEFEEKEVQSFAPQKSKFSKALHTINSCNEITFVDGSRFISN